MQVSSLSSRAGDILRRVIVCDQELNETLTKTNFLCDPD